MLVKYQSRQFILAILEIFPNATLKKLKRCQSIFLLCNSTTFAKSYRSTLQYNPRNICIFSISISILRYNCNRIHTRTFFPETKIRRFIIVCVTLVQFRYFRTPDILFNLLRAFRSMSTIFIEKRKSIILYLPQLPPKAKNTDKIIYLCSKYISCDLISNDLLSVTLYSAL